MREVRLEGDLGRLLVRAWSLEAVPQPGRRHERLEPCIVERLGEHVSLLVRHVGAVVNHDMEIAW